jgi:hypothetical protein
MSNMLSQAEVKEWELMAVYEYNFTSPGESILLSPAEKPPMNFKQSQVYVYVFGIS